jgi:hypothetical protein
MHALIADNTKTTNILPAYDPVLKEIEVPE